MHAGFHGEKPELFQQLTWSFPSVWEWQFLLVRVILSDTIRLPLSTGNPVAVVNLPLGGTFESGQATADALRDDAPSWTATNLPGTSCAVSWARSASCKERPCDLPGCRTSTTTRRPSPVAKIYSRAQCCLYQLIWINKPTIKSAMSVQTPAISASTNRRAPSPFWDTLARLQTIV